MTRNLLDDQIATLSPDGVYRYMLGRFWDHTGAILVWIMLNPSTADDVENDQTIHRCIGFARRLGFGGIVVVNLYAYRATDPREMEHAGPLAWGPGSPVTPIVGPENDRWIREVVDGTFAPGRARRVVAAWGARFEREDWHRRRVEHVRALVQRAGAELHCLDVTASGAPKHPHARGLHRIADDATPVRWPLGEPPLDLALLDEDPS